MLVVARPLALVPRMMQRKMNPNTDLQDTAWVRIRRPRGNSKRNAEQGEDRQGLRRQALGLPKKGGRFFRGLLCGGGQIFQQRIDKLRTL